MWWPELERQLAAVPTPAPDIATGSRITDRAPNRRPEREMLEELLGLVRDLGRSGSASSSANSASLNTRRAQREREKQREQDREDVVEHLRALLLSNADVSAVDAVANEMGITVRVVPTIHLSPDDTRSCEVLALNSRWSDAKGAVAGDVPTSA